MISKRSKWAASVQRVSSSGAGSYAGPLTLGPLAAMMQVRSKIGTELLDLAFPLSTDICRSDNPA